MWNQIKQNWRNVTILSILVLDQECDHHYDINSFRLTPNEYRMETTIITS